VKRWGLPVLAVLAAAVCMRLGFWQLDRLGQRRALAAEQEARMAQPAIRVGWAADLDRAVPFRRVTASGAFDFTHELVVVGRSHRGIPGVHVVTPLRLPDGGAMLVARGWVPSPDGRTVALEQLREPDSAAVEGILIQPGETAAPRDSLFPLFVRNASPVPLAAKYPYPLAPLVLQRTKPPPGAPEALRAVAPPVLGNGPHLSYAIQWFAFAVIALVGGVAYARTAVRSETRSEE